MNTMDKSLANKVGRAYQATYAQLVRFFHKRTGNTQDANDLSQDVFTLWLNRKAETPVNESRAFLFKIAHHVLIDHWQKNKKTQSVFSSETEENFPDAIDHQQANPQHALEQEQRLQRLAEALESLSPRRREAFLMYRFDGLSQSEVAERMGISISMVEKHIAGALVHCKNHVEKHEGNTE